MILTNEQLDLIDKEIDIALRIGPLADSGMVARRLGQFRTHVFASTGYIARNGEPLHPDELAAHRTFAFPKFARNGNFYWPLNDGERELDCRVEPVIVANDPSALTEPLLAGEGMMLLSEVSAKPYVERGLLRRVLAGWSGPKMDFNAVFPRGQVQAPKIRAFVDFLVDQLRFEVDYMRAACPDSLGCGKSPAPEPAHAASQRGRATTGVYAEGEDAEMEEPAEAA